MSQYAAQRVVPCACGSTLAHWRGVAAQCLNWEFPLPHIPLPEDPT